MKDLHAQIALLFTLLSEFSFKIYLRARDDNSSTDILALPVELLDIHHGKLI